MNINEWLEKTLTSIRSTDPKVLMAKMEEYGLIEDDVEDVESVQAVSVVTAAEIVEGMEFIGADIISNKYASSSYLWSAKLLDDNYLSYAQLTFTATPRDAASSLFFSPMNRNIILGCQQSRDNLYNISQAA